jgi:hypothetical protein
MFVTDSSTHALKCVKYFSVKIPPMIHYFFPMSWSRKQSPQIALKIVCNAHVIPLIIEALERIQSINNDSDALAEIFDTYYYSLIASRHITMRHYPLGDLQQFILNRLKPLPQHFIVSVAKTLFNALTYFLSFDVNYFMLDRLSAQARSWNIFKLFLLREKNSTILIYSKLLYVKGEYVNYLILYCDDNYQLLLAAICNADTVLCLPS